MSNNTDGAVTWWKDQGLKLLPGQAPESIRSRMLELNIQLAEDFIYLYSLCGGMAEGQIDEHWFELWPLERILQEHATCPSALIAFAGGFLAAHVYWLKANDSATSSVFIDGSYPGDPPRIVASTLEEAFHHLLYDQKKLELP